uniref:Truncated shufflon-specific DNA recombinase n=1 Tax=Escherichia coli TaxID=562 RepID=A0A0C5AXK1_ECOLX|nr:truncated shufflon-specific DNA recombinase [Escherichia coli]
MTLSDFDLETSAATKEQAIFHASVLLLRTLAQAAQRGEAPYSWRTSYKH